MPESHERFSGKTSSKKITLKWFINMNNVPGRAEVLNRKFLKSILKRFIPIMIIFLNHILL
jgi:hypothetical protein